MVVSPGSWSEVAAAKTVPTQRVAVTSEVKRNYFAGTGHLPRNDAGPTRTSEVRVGPASSDLSSASSRRSRGSHWQVNGDVADLYRSEPEGSRTPRPSQPAAG